MNTTNLPVAVIGAGPIGSITALGLVDFSQHSYGVTLHVSTPDGPVSVAAAYVLACDGSRSTVRERLGVDVRGHTLEQRYMLVDLVCDLDVGNPHDSGLRNRAYFDPGDTVRAHCGDVAAFLRPDDVEPWTVDSARNVRDRYLREVCLEG